MTAHPVDAPPKRPKLSLADMAQWVRDKRLDMRMRDGKAASHTWFYLAAEDVAALQQIEDTLEWLRQQQARKAR